MEEPLVKSFWVVFVTWSIIGLGRSYGTKTDFISTFFSSHPGTEKVRQAQGCKHLQVVNPDWLWSCLERWERVEEQLYPLKDDYSKRSRSNSPAVFHESLLSLQKHVVQSAAIRHRPAAPAPEIRTYDPVTGKLIRRGPRASRAPAFQAPGPLARSAQIEQSCLRYAEKGESFISAKIVCAQ